MTGFARLAEPGDALTIEIRSVNGRGLDLKLRLPPGFERLESSLRPIAERALARGNVTATITRKREDRPGLIVDQGLIHRASELQNVSSRACHRSAATRPRFPPRPTRRYDGYRYTSGGQHPPGLWGICAVIMRFQPLRNQDGRRSRLTMVDGQRTMSSWPTPMPLWKRD